MRRVFAYAIATCLCVCISTFAQTESTEDTTSDYSDVVLLTNGGKVQGKIVEYEEGKKVVVEREDGERIEIPFDKIDTITRAGEYEERQRQILDSLPYQTIDRMNPTVQLRLALWSDPGPDAVSGTIVVGRTLKGVVFAGLGANYDFSAGGSYLPIFVQGQYFMSTYRYAPYVSATAGYALAFVDGARTSDNDGFVASIALGLLFSFADKNGMTLQVEYRFQDVNESHPYHPKESGFTFISLGVAF